MNQPLQPLRQHTTQTLAAVIERAAKGDRAAFEDLYRSSSQKLFGIIFRILKQQELAEEVLQEVYIKIWNKAADFDASLSSPITWMATIARNRSLDEVRKRQLPQNDNDQDTDMIVDTSMAPDLSLSVNQDLKRLEDCLSQLEAPRSEMIKAAYLEGFSRQELAERFNQPLGTVKTWLHRGIKQLQDCLGI